MFPVKNPYWSDEFVTLQNFNREFCKKISFQTVSNRRKKNGTKEQMSLKCA